MKTIRLRQYDTEATVAEQMVAFFSFSRKEQEAQRLSFKRKVYFDRLLMEHRDGLTHNQHMRIESIESSLTEIAKREFLGDRFYIDYNRARSEISLLQQEREEKFSTNSKIVDAMVPIIERYASGERLPFGVQRPVRRPSQLPPTPRGAAHNRFLHQERERLKARDRSVFSPPVA